jgi:uncharacterized membrane protein YcaP (DUF421 family)
MATVVRAALLWVFLILVMRAIGRKELSELSPFEFVLLVVMGDLIQQGVTEQDSSVTAAVLAVSTMVLLTLAVSYAGFRWPRVAPLLGGSPVVVIRDGRVQRSALRIERLTIEDVEDAAREQGIGDLRDVRMGVLEADGTFSFVLGRPPTEAQRRGGKKRTK